MSSNSVGRLGHKFSVTRLGEFLKLKLCHKFSCKSSLNIWSLFGQSLLTPFLKKKLLWTLLGQPLEKIGHTGLTIAPTHTRLPKACNSIALKIGGRASTYVHFISLHHNSGLRVNILKHLTPHSEVGSNPCYQVVAKSSATIKNWPSSASF